MKKAAEGTGDAAVRILLVDDNRNGLLARKAVLQAEGYSVTECSTPAEATQLFNTESFALVVTDYRMPEMNGQQLIASFREINAAIPIVLVSGLVDVLGLTERGTGADAVIAKNSSEVANIVRAVNRLLHRGKAARKPARGVAGRTRSPRAKAV